MQKLKLFLCLWILLDVLAGYAGFLPMPGARAQGSPPGITYVTTGQNWSQASTTALTAAVSGSVTLTPCPAGVDYTSAAGYQVYITDGPNSEAVSVTGGSTGSGICSITFTPFFSHRSYTIGSASSGIQETINVACGTDPTPYKNSQCNVTIPANGGPATGGGGHSLNTYNIYGTIFFHALQSTLDGSGVSLNCLERGPCLQVGNRVNSNGNTDNIIEGLTFRSPTNNSANLAYIGCPITQTQTTGTTATVTTSSACGFRAGDMVTIQFTDDGHYWGDALVATASGTTFTFTKASFTTTALQTTPGFVALAYDAILDNATNTHFQDISYDYVDENGHFTNFFDFWDDENALIEHFNNSGIPVTITANWVGSFIYSGGGPWYSGQQWAPVITLRDSSITANGSNGVTVDNSNGLYIENTVIQASGPWQVKSSNVRGNYQGAYLKNIYSESNVSLNYGPFAGLGIAGLIAGQSTAAAYFQISGSGVEGAFQTGGTGSTPYSYFIVANDTTNGARTSPMQILNWNSTGSDLIPVHWPRVANGTDVITYDVIRITTPNSVYSVYPYNGGCPGGSGGTCGSVATAISQATACSASLVCTYTDSGSSSTSAYTINEGNYNGNLNFWPGAIVSVGKSVKTDVEQWPVVGVGLNGNPIQIADMCTSYGATSPGGYTTCLASINTPNNSVKNQTATILTDGPDHGGGMSLSKGRLNFSSSAYSSIGPHHIITLIDSQPALTQAMYGYRPPASGNDTWIGTDVPSGGVVLTAGQLAFGAPVSITNYIRATGDGVHMNWLERLTSKQKTFAVPVRISEGNSFTLGDGSPLSQMKIYSVNNIPASHVPSQSCVDVVGEARGLTRSDQITGITPPGRLVNLSLNAYPADEDAIILHFCNPSRSEAITPPGAYSFLAVR